MEHKPYTTEEFASMVMAMGPFNTSEGRMIATIEKLLDERDDLADCLRAIVLRVELENRDGNKIGSAWRVDAEKVLARITN